MNQIPARADTPMLPVAATLCWREWVRFLRQRSRVTAALGTPLLMWVFIGAGLDGSFRAPAAMAAGAASRGGYLGYFFPGAILLVVLFTAIFSTISIIEDRSAGFLQAVLAAPVSRGSIVLGKILGGTLLGVLQGALFLLLAPLAGVPLTVSGAAAALVAMFFVAFALTGLGFMIAWRMESIAGFHGVMNLLLMPMWILSGAVFPPAGARSWLAWVVHANPLSYGLGALQHALGVGAAAAAPIGVCAGVSVAFAGIMFLAATAVARPTSERG